MNVATMIGTVNGMSKFGPICLVHNRVSGADRSALQRHPQPGLKRVLTCNCCLSATSAAKGKLNGRVLQGTYLPWQLTLTHWKARALSLLADPTGFWWLSVVTRETSVGPFTSVMYYICPLLFWPHIPVMMSFSKRLLILTELHRDSCWASVLIT